jgi:hypothetical protein
LFASQKRVPTNSALKKNPFFVQILYVTIFFIAPYSDKG